MSMQKNIVYTQLEDRVLTITLNRPESKNAITAELNVRLNEVLKDAAINSDVGAIILTGEGKMFCVGGDVNRMSVSKTQRRPANMLSIEELLTLGAESSMLLHQMSKPTIALIRGAAAGGGVSLAAGCDLRFASPSVKFTYAYSKIGLSGDFAGSYLLQQWLGATKAREFCLLSPLIGSEEALAIGLITRIVADDEIQSYSYKVARQLANGPSYAIGKVKENLNNAQSLSIEKSIRLEVENFLGCQKSTEYHEALAAFVEKREPNFHSS